MEKEFVGYNEALDLKELGFESPYPIGGFQGGKVFYYENNELYYDGRPMYSSDAHSGQLLAPLYQQAFRWFREKYGLQHEITRQGTNYWLLTILEIDKVTINGIFNGKKYDLDDYIKNEPRTYEEAELECLKKLIEIVKEKK